MRKLAHFILLAAILSTGCASDYMTNRWRDTLDMATCTLNSSIGIRERVGPFSAGLYAGVELGGLRGGECKWINAPDGYQPVSDVDLTLFAREAFMPPNFEIARARGKLFESKGILMIVPLVTMDGEDHPWMQYLPYYTDAQATFGLLYGLRLGLNIGEVVDWLGGWCLIDIFADDIGTEDEYARYAKQYQEQMRKNMEMRQQEQGTPQDQQSPLLPPKQPAPEQPAPQPAPQQTQPDPSGQAPPAELLPNPAFKGFQPIGGK